MVTFNRENNPNASILTVALRSLGYDNISAINDILDNSLDAGANRIVIETLQDGGNSEIRIIDNGFGMNYTVLDQAMRLGSDVERDLTEELGKFGMGLCTASISIARRLEVLTKEAGSDKILKSITDIDEVIKANAFVKYLGEADQEDIELFNKYLDDQPSGTIIRLRNCDKVTSRSVTTFATRLIKEIGRCFRDYIESGREFYVNGKKVEAIDIFHMADGGEIYSDESYEVIIKDEHNNNKDTVETVRVRLAILPDYGLEGNREKGINASNQGFYVMRNNREIANGETLGLYTRHPSFNRIRGEIYFSATLDELMGVNFTKKRVDLDQSIYDKIQADLKHQLISMRKLADKARAAEQSKGVNHDESERVITKKAPLLNLPKVEEPKVQTPKKKKDNDDNNDEVVNTEKKPKRPTPQKRETRARFIAEHGGKGGHFYEARLEGKTTVIAWNIDHPFYERFVVGSKENKTLATSVDFLVYSLATAELGLLNDENIEMVDNFKTIMSMNLNTLLR